MNLQDKLISLSEYNISFRFNEGNIIVSIEYKDGWSVINPEDEGVKLMKSKEKNVFFYCAEIDSKNMHIQSIFDTIDETIRYNKENEARFELFKESIKELEKLFSEKTYKELKTLRFVTKAYKEATKKSKKKKNDPVKDDEVNLDGVAVSNYDTEETENCAEETTTDFDKMIEKSIKNKENKK